MGSYWSYPAETAPGFDDFFVKYPLSEDLRDFFEFESGIRRETCSRTTIIRAIIRWVQSQGLFDKETQCIVCDPVLAHLFSVKNLTLVNYEQIKTALDHHFTALETVQEDSPVPNPESEAVQEGSPVPKSETVQAALPPCESVLKKQNKYSTPSLSPPVVTILPWDKHELPTYDEAQQVLENYHPAETDKDGVVTQVTIFLAMIRRSQGVEIKTNLCRQMFRMLAANVWFLEKNQKFCEAVKNKIINFETQEKEINELASEFVWLKDYPEPTQEQLVLGTL
jgi:hypothetical protein